MSKEIYKKVLVEEKEINPGQWQRSYKKVLDEDAMKKAEAEAKRKAEEAKKKAEADAKRKAAEAKKKAEAAAKAEEYSAAA